MKNVRIILVVGLLIAAIAGGVAYYMYNKPHENVASAKADQTLTADELYATINGKDSVTVKSFNGKVYQVTGTIGSIVAPNDSSVNILLSITGNSTDNINCAMDPAFNKRLQNLKAGDKLTIKGIFTGINKFEDKDLGINTLDVILSRAVAVRD